jgi:U3 small nucleolar RNA-associated protein MPP10
LEEDLDFEHVRKVTPVITEESVKSLEDLIKKRILDVSLLPPEHRSRADT